MEHFAGPGIQTAIGLLMALGGLLLILRMIPPSRSARRTSGAERNTEAWYKTRAEFGWLYLVVGSAVAAMSLWASYPVHPALPLVGVLVAAAAAIWIRHRNAA